MPQKSWGEMIESMVIILVIEFYVDFIITVLLEIKVVVFLVSTPLDQAIPCGLILNEWVSNAMKYAFEGRESGTISVGLKAVDVEGKPEEEEIQIEVKDDGVGLPEGFDWSGRDSLG